VSGLAKLRALFALVIWTWAGVIYAAWLVCRRG
jgi:hypothetical protein